MTAEPAGDPWQPSQEASDTEWPPKEAEGVQDQPEVPAEPVEPEKPVKKRAPRKTAEPTAPTAGPTRGKSRGNNRKSGMTAASEEAAKQADDMTEPPRTEELPDERNEWFRSPGFQRMKTVWEGPDLIQMQRVQSLIDQKVFDTFTDAYIVMSDLYDIVREPQVTPDGEIVTDAAGLAVWARHPISGSYIEDWTRLGSKQREDFLFRLVTSMFDWEQRAADLWTESMFAKGMFTEKFAIEYDAPISGTIDDRNARGNVEAAEDRYFALMNAGVSRKADALVRTMNSLMLRLRDSLSS